MGEKTIWQGTITAVQPRILLTRSFDQRSHSYLGYVLRLEGTVAGQNEQFLIAIGPEAQKKHAFRAGDLASGCAEAVSDPRQETAEFYKASKLKLLARLAEPYDAPPPWRGIPPELSVYRQRGHRRLSARTYESKCLTCIWGCKMAVEMIIDHWKPDLCRYRQETFCYGPKSCRLYAAGPVRKVPGRKGMSWEEADWIDDDATAHRGDDE